MVCGLFALWLAHGVPNVLVIILGKLMREKEFNVPLIAEAIGW
jgi:hypothetical protein